MNMTSSGLQFLQFEAAYWPAMTQVAQRK